MRLRLCFRSTSTTWRLRFRPRTPRAPGGCAFDCAFERPQGDGGLASGRGPRGAPGGCAFDCAPARPQGHGGCASGQGPRGAPGGCAFDCAFKRPQGPSGCASGQGPRGAPGGCAFGCVSARPQGHGGCASGRGPRGDPGRTSRSRSFLSKGSPSPSSMWACCSPCSHPWTVEWVTHKAPQIRPRTR